jgi:Tfp pilus assembly protein PilF
MQGAIEACSRGTAYSVKGRPEKAVVQFREAIRLDSNYAEAYRNRAVAFLDKGEVDRAEADRSRYREIKSPRKKG